MLDFSKIRKEIEIEIKITDTDTFILKGLRLSAEGQHNSDAIMVKNDSDLKIGLISFKEYVEVCFNTFFINWKERESFFHSLSTQGAILIIDEFTRLSKDLEIVKKKI